MNRRNLMGLMLAATVAIAASAISESGAAVRGNPKSKVYHTSSCKHYTSKGASTEFKSPAAAQEAGYAPCKTCNRPETKSDKGSVKTAGK